jgi:putative FmdB family regulatory protein
VPTYAYACTACGHRFEVQQSFTDASLTACPECEGRLRKLFNSVGIVFKGSGFYRTDSRNGSSAESGAKDSKGNETSGPAKESNKESGKETGSSAKESSSSPAKEGASSSSSKPATSAA